MSETPEFTTFTVNAKPELDSVRTLAVELMAAHGLDGWTLKFDSARSRAGICRRKAREISLSEPLMLLWTEDQQRDTILHEIAHALTVGGHGAEWQRMCLMIGADPTRTWGHNGEARIAKRWTGTCPNGHEIKRDRRSRKPMSCAVCSPVFNSRYLITWERS